MFRNILMLKMAKNKHEHIRDISHLIPELIYNLLGSRFMLYEQNEQLKADAFFVC